MTNKLLSFLTKPFTDFIKKKKNQSNLKKKLKSIPNYSSFKEIKELEGNLNNFENELLKYGKIGIILGARGSGKSALGMKILENIASKEKKGYALGFRIDRLPKWITHINNINEVTNNSFLLVDEAGIEFSSRSSMKNTNKLLSDLLLISRHKSISIIFITQNSSNIEINTLRQADYLLLKPSSLLQLDFERKKIKDIYKEVIEIFKKHPDKDTTYVYSDFYRGFVKVPLPSFWTEDLSKSYSK